MSGLSLLISACERTDYAPGFSKEQFNEVAIGDTVNTVLKKLGPPLRITRYSTKPTSDPIAEDKLWQIVELKDIEKASHEENRMLILSYSLQADPRKDFWRFDLSVRDGVVTSRVVERVTE
jgi:hypothetical protein